MYYVHLLKDQANQKTYIGYSSDPRRRLKGHKSKNPDPIYYEAYKSKKDASRREFVLKSRGQTVRRLKERLKFSLL